MSRRRWTIALVGLVAAVVIGATLFARSQGDEDRSAPSPAADATVTVLLAEPVRNRGSMNGFIHSLSAVLPADDKVMPLSPRLWRSEPGRAPIDRATAFGAQYELVLSDLWGYPQSDWNGRGPPWRDLAAWERFVRQTARAYRDEPVAWDIWNEPNDPGFWRGGRRRFFDVYARANRMLRSELRPDAEIGGPSISRYAPDWLADFLDRCLVERCRLDFLSWHENLEPSDPLDSVSEHLGDGRRRFVNGSRYRPLGIRTIHVNEYVGKTDRYLPGEAVSYLEQLEAGGADLAARSCWSREDCGPAQLDGLLSADSSPRSTWWAHRWYAEGVGSRVTSRSNDPALTVLASAPTLGAARVLLGHTAPRGSGSRSSAKVIDLAVEGLGPANRAALTVDRLPASGDAPLPRPERIEQREVKLDRGALRVSLPPLEPHEAALVKLSPLGG